MKLTKSPISPPATACQELWSAPVPRLSHGSNPFCLHSINPQASGRNSAVDEVAVTYIILPQTRTATRGVPDLTLWQKEVERSLGETGGLGNGVFLHDWQHAPDDAKGESNNRGREMTPSKPNIRSDG